MNFSERCSGRNFIFVSWKRKLSFGYFAVPDVVSASIPYDVTVILLKKFC